MAGDMLPPIIAELTLNYEQFVEGIKTARDQMSGVAASVDDLDKSADTASSSLDTVGASAEKAAGSLTTVSRESDVASGGLDRIGEGGDLASAGLDKTAASADRAASAMARTDVSGAGQSLEKVGQDASQMGGNVSKAASDVEKAEDDAESHSSGFSSKVSSIFTHVGESMGKWGIPFGSSVTKMGEKIDEAESKGKGFSGSMVQVGKVATAVSGVALAAFAGESVHMADEFDVANVQLQTAIKNTGSSFADLEPKINSTYSSMAKLGFNQQEVAESMQALTISTKNPTKAMEDESIAADLARAKNQSLGSATSTLTKVYAGSTRALTQLGINLDVGTGKLKSIQSATESVTTAQQAVKTAQLEAAEATGEKAPVAAAKLEAAQLKLSQAETKLKMNQEATGNILSTVKQRTEDAAKAYGTTLAGQMKTAGAEVHNLGVSFGEFLMPALGAAAKVLTDFIKDIEEGNPIVVGIASVIGGTLVLAITSYVASLTVAMVKSAASFVAMIAGWIKTAAAATVSAGTQVLAWLRIGATSEAVGGEQLALFVEEDAGWMSSAAAAVAGAAATVAAWVGIGDAAMAGGAATAAGIALATAGVSLLIVGIVELALHWKEVWSTIKTVVGDAVEFVKQHLTLILLALAPLTGGMSLLALATINLANHWKEIWSAISSFTSGIVKTIVGFFAKLPSEIVSFISRLPGDIAQIWKDIESGIGHFLSDVVKFFEQLPGKIMGAVEALPGDMLSLGEKIMQAIISGVEHLASDFVGVLKKTILGPVESIVGAVEGIFGGGGSSKSTGTSSGVSLGSLPTSFGAMAGTTSESGVEGEILKTALARGLSPQAAAGMVGNAHQESTLTPDEPGGGLYQMSGYSESDAAGSAVQQTEKALELMGPSLIAEMNKAKSAAEASTLMEKNWEKPAGSQPGETATTNNRPGREKWAEEAEAKIKSAISQTSPTTSTNAIKNAVGTSTPTTAVSAVKNAISTTKSTAAAEAVKQAVETAKFKLTEVKAAFTSAFSEMVKDAEKLFKYTLAKGGVKSKDLTNEEAAREAGQNATAVTGAEESLRKAESTTGITTAKNEAEVAKRKQIESEAALVGAQSKLTTAEKELHAGRGSKSSVESAQSSLASAEGTVTSARESTAKAEEGISTAQTTRTAEIKSAQESLNNALYTVKVASLKKEAAAEEAAVAKENAAKQAAFSAALAQLKTHLEKGKVSTEQAMKDIEKVLKKYGVTFGAVGKDAGAAWVKQFEAAIKKAATDAGGITAEITADIKAGLKIPGLAVGGIVTSPTLAYIGEAGPEAVVPLSQYGGLSALGGTVAPLPATLTPSAVSTGTSGGLHVNEINLYGQNATSADLVKELYYQLRPMLTTS